MVGAQQHPARRPDGDARQASLRAIARELHTLRVAAGSPSFSALADSVSRVRQERGMAPAAARTSVYDLFRLDRKV